MHSFDDVAERKKEKWLMNIETSIAKTLDRCNNISCVVHTRAALKIGICCVTCNMRSACDMLHPNDDIDIFKEWTKR